MSKAKKGWIITAIALTVIGAILFISAFSVLGFDPAKLASSKPETNTYEITEAFDTVSVDVSTANVAILPSDDGKCRVVCEETEKTKHSVAVENGALMIASSDTRAWYELISFNFCKINVTVYLTEKEYSSLSINESTGNITIRSQAVKNGIDVKTSTGNILLNSVISKGAMNVKTSTGSVVFEGSDAGEIHVKTSTGNVAGTLLSAKVFTANTSTGNVSIPDTTSGGRCEIETSTGNINIKIK